MHAEVNQNQVATKQPEENMGCFEKLPKLAETMPFICTLPKERNAEAPVC